MKMLQDKGIQPSVQRIEILTFLIANRIHPTAEIIYDRLHPAIPTLSRTTVYNTLRLFVEHDLVQVLTIEDKEARFDIDTSLHGHFKCDACGSVYDFSAPDLPPEKMKDLEGFMIRERHVYFRGTCAMCAKNI